MENVFYTVKPGNPSYQT